jgi:ABC-type dipeptide/oligopeptide/nickel transport system ATPase component
MISLENIASNKDKKFIKDVLVENLNTSFKYLTGYKFIKYNLLVETITSKKTNDFQKILDRYSKEFQKIILESKKPSLQQQEKIVDWRYEVLKDHYQIFFTFQKKLDAYYRIINDMSKVLDEKTIEELKKFKNLKDYVKAFDSNTQARRNKQDIFAKLDNDVLLNDHVKEKLDKFKEEINYISRTINGRNYIFDEILKNIYAFSLNWKFAINTMLNIVLMGSAGSGKSFISESIANLYSYAGLLFYGTKIINRTDLISQYYGQSRILTDATMTDSLEHMVILDESYDIAKCDKYSTEDSKTINKFGKTLKIRKCDTFNSYGDESVTSIIQFLSENVGGISMIIIGYPALMIESWLSINEGVNRRFTQKFYFEDYSVDQLLQILVDKLSGYNYVMLSNEAIEAFKKHYSEKYPRNGAGDVSNLFSKIYVYFQTKQNKKPLNGEEMEMLLTRYEEENYF